jgi:4-amino-4-deoxy-L-arabinose transferase-like glycosyltransferase
MNATTFPPRPLAGPLRRRPRVDATTHTAERTQPRWAKPGLMALLLLTAIAYTVDLSASGYANSFYAAAVQAATKSWKAFFFGSIDSSNFITVDKPPASLWVMALSGRIFGFSSWSMLVPQALEGVAAVALLHAAVKRWFGAGAGLLAGALLAITPVAALMFRFNNPDALLVCLMVAGAYCLTRAMEHASTRWVLAAGTMIGFAFLAKMMQAFLVLPAFGLVYLVAAPTSLRRRVSQLAMGGLAIVMSAGWWVAIVALWPAGDRPFIDGSPDNSILNLIVGYNGLGRIFGATGPGGGGGGGNFSGATGTLRLFNDLMGGQASWLLPAALLAFVAGLWHTRRAPRTDRTRAALLLWGGWLIVSAAVFSFGSGVIHTYYTVALVPAIAALIAITAPLLWRERHTLAARVQLAVAVLVTAAWSWALLDRSPQWESWLRVLIALAAVLAAACLLAAPSLSRLGRRASIFTGVLIIVATLSGPLAYSAQTITSAHTGSIPSAGPASASSGGGMGGMPGGGTQRVVRAGGGSATGAPGGQSSVSSALEKALETDASSYRWVAATSGSQSAASLELATGGEPVMAIGGFNNEGGNLSLAQFEKYVAAGDIHYYIASSSGGGGGGLTQGGAAGRSAASGKDAFGAAGGLGGTPPSGAHAGGGTPPSGGTRPGAARSGGGAPMGGGSGSSTSSITSWVKAHYKALTIGGQTVYDLTQASSLASLQ